MSEAKSGKRIDNCFYCVCGMITVRTLDLWITIQIRDPWLCS